MGEGGVQRQVMTIKVIYLDQLFENIANTKDRSP